ncbi:hypothetical protein OAS86_01725 [Gammaproteobacteria bacterium]|nr:hypothetical protein [Gammaproteobacteria bacterium]
MNRSQKELKGSLTCAASLAALICVSQAGADVKLANRAIISSDRTPEATLEVQSGSNASGNAAFMVRSLGNNPLLFVDSDGRVGSGTETPEASLDIRAANHLGVVTTNDGILVPRVNALSVSGSVQGQLVYLTGNSGTYSEGFHYWDGSDWSRLINEEASGRVLNVAAFTQSDGIQVNTTANSTTFATILSTSYTPVSNSSRLLITVDLDYYILGWGEDRFLSRITVDGLQIASKEQRSISNSGAGTRSSVLSPIQGYYNNASVSPLTINFDVRRLAGDDSFTTLGIHRLITVTEISN